MNEQVEFDFIVIGSGAGALAAAIRASDLGLRTLVIEKSEYFGGSSAMSGGGLWIPNNHDMMRAGVHDSDAEAIAYLKHITGGKVADAKIRAFVRTAPKMIGEFHQRGILKTRAIGNYCDYYPDAPGAKPGGRTMEALSFNVLRLGSERKHLRPTTLLLFNRISAIASEACHNVSGTIYGQLLAMKRVLFWALSPGRLIATESLMLGLGQTLVAPLRLELKKRGVPLWLNSPAKQLIVENNRVVGVEVEQQGKRVTLRAARGVLMATGGFDHNQAMRETHLPNPTSGKWSAGNLHNTGDAIVMGQQVGARLAFMDDAWWSPTMQAPGFPTAWILVYEKNMPHGIFVDSAGKRFVNESGPYIDVVSGMYRHNGPGKTSVPCWMIFDANYRRQNALGKILPSRLQPDTKIDPAFWDNILFKADTLAGLANKIGVPADELQHTVTRYNGFCATGVDADFNRGGNICDRFYGKVKYKNPTMGPLAKAPFYAARIEAGDIGTKGGLDTNEHAQVLREDGSVIAGLYACGNCSSSVMGYSYAGAGATLGPAMTFGYIAAETAAAGQTGT